MLAVFILKFDNIPHLFLVFQQLNLKKVYRKQTLALEIICRTVMSLLLHLKIFHNFFSASVDFEKKLMLAVFAKNCRKQTLGLETIGRNLISLLLNLRMFHIFFYCFYS